MLFIITLLVIYFASLAGLIFILFKNNSKQKRMLSTLVRMRVGKLLTIKNGKVYLNGKEESNSSKIGMKLLQYADSTIADTKIINSFDDL
jgi:hypothetical protein